MIRPININLNAAHPELPLVEATTFTGAPSSVFIRGVPKAVGNWSITAVSVAVTYPDNTTTARAAVESAEGVWVATIPGTATSGRTEAGFRILADGIDENGAAVTGYVLGFADFSVLSFMPVPAPGGTFWYLRYFDTMPTTPKKGDVAKIDGVLKFYNGSAWEPFGCDLSGAVRYDIAQTLSDGQAAQARDNIKATLAARGPNHDGFSAWKVTKTDPSFPYELEVFWGSPESSGADEWYFSADIGGYFLTGNTDPSATSISCAYATATRTALPGYQLGNDDQHILATQADMSAAKTAIAGKYAKPSGGIPASDLAAAVQTSLGKADNALQESGGTISAGSGNDLVLGADLGGGYVTAKVSSGAELSLTPTKLFVKSSTDQYSHEIFLPHTDGTLALAAGTGHIGNLAALDSQGNPTDSGVKPSDKLDSTSAAPAFSSDSSTQYAVGAHVTYNGKLYVCTTATTGGTWVAGSWAEDMASNYFQYALTTKTIDNNAVTLDDRAMNAVAVSSALASLTINFPTATSGKARDFGLRLTVASGITTAPQIVLPQGVTCENADGAAPEIGADGAATILYFTETAANVFLVKGEVVTAVS